MLVDELDFTLPQGAIALEPAPVRDQSRMMVLDRGAIYHQQFNALPRYMRAGDMLILNRTKVTPVNLRGVRPDGSALDVLLVRPIEGELIWEVLSRGGYSGPVEFQGGLSATLAAGRRAELKYDGDLGAILWDIGRMPLPPYIKREPDARDKLRYQTVYAEREGSIAAPTAGLHFTPELIARLMAMGVNIRYITLHVGRGTFAPIRVSELAEHRMDSERFEVAKELLEEVRARKGRLFSVGTTCTRTLEALMCGWHSTLDVSGGVIKGETDIFIQPGHEFKAVDALITNFHLPRSTPLVLAAAFAGREPLMRAYQEAMAQGYKFFSYGDSMLITEML